jgi:hypothetical protein
VEELASVARERSPSIFSRYLSHASPSNRNSYGPYPLILTRVSPGAYKYSDLLATQPSMTDAMAASGKSRGGNGASHESIIKTDAKCMFCAYIADKGPSQLLT